MMQTTTRYLPALLLAAIGLTLPFPACADSMPAAVDFGQPATAASNSAPSPAAGSQALAPRGQKAHARSKTARNPLAVDSRIAVKATPVKEIDLPGVLHVPGEKLGMDDPTRSQKVSWTNQGSKTVYLSVTEPNRIVLPFRNPYIVRMSDVTVDHRPESNNLYVYWNVSRPEDAQPRQIYVEPPGGGGQALGLEIVPKMIPGQTILVTDDTGITARHKPAAGDSSEYVTHVQDLMASVALGESPNGFSQVDVDLPPIGMDGLTVTADTRYSGQEGDLWVYTVRNPRQTIAQLREQEFDGPSVLAVSIYPKPLLQPGERARVFVLARKREEQ